jgi:hypothetical protein
MSRPGVTVFALQAQWNRMFLETAGRGMGLHDRLHHSLFPPELRVIAAAVRVESSPDIYRLAGDPRLSRLTRDFSGIP